MGGIADALLLWSPWHPVPGDSITAPGPLVESPGTQVHGGHNKRVSRTRLFLRALDQTGPRGGCGRETLVARPSRAYATRDVRAIAVIYIVVYCFVGGGLVPINEPATLHRSGRRK